MLPRTQYWVVYLDNFYTSLPLLRKLRQSLKIGGCGTVRPSSARFPVDLKTSKKEIFKFDYHFVQLRVLKAFGVEVGVLLWFDNAPVTIMTTVHDLGAEVEKLRRRPGRKGTNAQRAREAFGDDQEKMMAIPQCIDDYNQHLGGVNTADQLRSYYDTQLTPCRTWWPMFFWAVDMMLGVTAWSGACLEVGAG